MPVRPAPLDTDDDLDLPPLDGEGDGPEEATDGHGEDLLDLADDDGDAMDDATFDDPTEDLLALGGVTSAVFSEASVVGDIEDNELVDVGNFDLALSDEGKLLEDDEPDGRPLEGEDDLADAAGATFIDAGEEGPLADDEELREEDLPALDADDDGDVDDVDLYDEAALASDVELRWDDRAWERDEHPAVAADSDEADDSGVLAVPGIDRQEAARDAAWRELDATGRVSAATVLPGGAVILALAAPDQERTLLVRVQSDGSMRIIAEIDRPDRVVLLRWDAAKGRLLAFGAFGTQAFRPT